MLTISIRTREQIAVPKQSSLGIINPLGEFIIQKSEHYTSQSNESKRKYIFELTTVRQKCKGKDSIKPYIEIIIKILFTEYNRLRCDKHNIVNSEYAREVLNLHELFNKEHVLYYNCFNYPIHFK